MVDIWLIGVKYSSDSEFGKKKRMQLIKNYGASVYIQSSLPEKKPVLILKKLK
jgi:hypothetical protein